MEISKKIEEVFDSLSKSQRKIATAILDEYETVGFMTAQRFSSYVGVSESTVVRFATELGFEGYAEFQSAIRDLVKTKLTPNQRIEFSKSHFIIFIITTYPIITALFACCRRGIVFSTINIASFSSSGI